MWRSVPIQQLEVWCLFTSGVQGEAVTGSRPAFFPVVDSNQDIGGTLYQADGLWVRVLLAASLLDAGVDGVVGVGIVDDATHVAYWYPPLQGQDDQ